MNRRISFYVSGSPVAQPRPRAFARKMGDKYVARVYQAGTAESWKSEIAVAAKEAGLEKFDGPISLELFFSFRRPKSHFKKDGHLRDNAPQFHIQRPDADNCAKACLDCLTTLGAWSDDDQVVCLTIDKGWAIGSSAGGCLIAISEVG